MFQIICPECSNANNFELVENKPVECSFCFTTFTPDISVEEIADTQKGATSGLKLIYQKTSEIIEIKGDINIVGRESVGANLLSAIKVNGKPVISRKHCSISKIDGKFYLLDEGSTNGTFFGINKIDCTNSPQEIKNNSIIFIGQEAFLVQFIYEEPKVKETDEITTKEEEPQIIRKYRCNEGCGFETETFVEICPKCMTSNSLVEIRE